MRNSNTYKVTGKQAKMLLFAFSVCIAIGAYAQNVGINKTGATPDKSAVLDLSPNTNGGFLLPTVTSTQLTGIPTPPYGTLIFNSTTNCMEGYYSSGWQNIICPCSGAPAAPTISGNTNLTVSTTGYVYTATSTGATSFTWTVPAAVGTITAGQGTSSITVTAAGSAGSGNITATATNSCGTSASSANYNVTVTSTCSGIISLDAKGTSGSTSSSSASFTITTTQANDLVIIAATGYSSGNYNGTITVTGGGGPTATLFGNKSTTDAAIAIYYFVAPTATKYTIKVTSGSHYSQYDCFAVGLTGFCSTPTGADIVASNSATSSCSCGSMSATLSEAAGSYALGFFTDYWYSNSNKPTWTNLTSFNGSSDYDNTYGDAGKAISSAGTPTITASQTEIDYGVLYLLDIH